ncbi:MAG TPA: LysM peptidoglycan-binding domain-containing protein [Flavobacterium sp.]|jgi:LysM repeat protein
MKISRLKFTILLIAIFFISHLSAQESIKHTVVKGETITQIAQKYRVTPFDIYSLNPKAEAGIKENDVILVPTRDKGLIAASQSKNPSTPNIQKPGTHTAKAKETLFSIAREYNVTVADLHAANPFLSEGLKVGQVLAIPSRTVTVTKKTEVQPTQTHSTNEGKSYSHVVESKETKFGIAKKYGISVAELERQNPGIVNGLQVGYKLTINGPEISSEPVTEKPQPVTTEISSTSTSTTEVIRTVKREGFANYEVKPGDTMYSLTKMLGISQDEMVRLNPELADGVKVGMILKVPGRGSLVIQDTKSNDLIKTISKKKRQLVLLMPFNADKIQNDTLKSLSSRLKKDAFLNMTLDFYSGALMAIDSAKTLGLNVDVKIYDSQESKVSSDVENIVRTKDLKSANAIIGPFYQQYAERVAELLNADNVPVISPLSKEDGKPISNLYQAMPTTDFAKRSIFDYMVSKNGNILVISDPKKVTNRDFITQNYPQARFVGLTENGGLIPENLKSMLVTDRINYVVLDSEKTGTILGTTNVLLNELSSHQIQLAIIEPNETLDFEEISMKRLTILKLLYPSQTRENSTPEAMTFENAYKRKNKVYPSQYAVRGFDITFDTLLRIAQEKGFAASALEDKTEHVESKFSYAAKDSPGFINKGVYILQYEEDLSVKEAN